MRIVGIDNGLQGGLVGLDRGFIYRLWTIPTVTVKKAGKKGGVKNMYDTNLLATVIKEMCPEHAFLEKAQPMKGNGITSTFSTGYGYGVMQGILSAFQIPYTLVHPKTWQKVMFLGLDKTDTKAMAYLACSRLWPKQDWRPSERAKKPHEGLCDAACIAEYGRRTLAST